MKRDLVDISMILNGEYLEHSNDLMPLEKIVYKLICACAESIASSSIKNFEKFTYLIINQ